MEITWLKNEDNAIQYVYASAVPQKIPLDIFKEIVQSISLKMSNGIFWGTAEA